MQDEELIAIRRQFNKVIKDFSPTKGKEERRVPCNSHVLAELTNWIESRKIGPDKTIFQNEAGQPIDHDNFVKRHFIKDVQKWGGRRIRFHDLRHTATTLMIASGVDLKTAQEICGHEDIKTTMNYAHFLFEKIRETARNFAIIPQTDPEPPAPELVLGKNVITGNFGRVRKMVDPRLTLS